MKGLSEAGSTRSWREIRAKRKALDKARGTYKCAVCGTTTALQLDHKRMTRDVTGYANRDQNVKYELKAGEVYFVSVDVAAEFITKGYAAGELPRPVSDDEAAEWRAQQTIIRPGG